LDEQKLIKNIFTMKKIYILLLTLTISSLSFGQVINEVDADTPGTDAAEFIEIKHTPNTALDGHVVVLFNGGGDISYAAYDLSGKTTDANGLFIIANTALVTGSDIDMGASNKLQNGADAVALFTGSATDFPNGTAVTNTNMLSGVVYDTGDSDDTGLLAVIGGIQYDERENSSSDTQSIQRKSDGTYEVKNITFRDLNSAATCDLSMSSPSVVCDAITASVDTYTATINFTGGGGGGSFVVTADSGTVDLSAGDPTTDATGTITVTGVTEGTDVTVNVADGGICNIDYTIFSADCEPALELPLYEGFDYNVGANLEDQANWTGFFSGDNILVGGPGGLTYAGLASQTGNHISFDGGGIDNKIEFTGVTSGEVFASFIFNITDQSSITDLNDGGYFAALAQSDSSFDTRIWVHPTTDPVGTTYEISITNASSGAVFAGSYNVGDNVLIVLSYAPGVGTVKGWVNPTSLGGVEPTPDFSETDATVAATIDRFIVRQDSTGETPSILFDELRIGTSFEEVTPTTLSNADFVSDAFKLYPNPSKSGFVNITSTGSETILATVFDILGKQVINAAVSNERLDVSTLNTGVYIVKMTQGAATTTKKLIIQ
jgi:hypothetical protein